ncbi:MAG: sigma-54 interaction domain-containing protein, partial [Gemmatimonadota bacterium]
GELDAIPSDTTACLLLAGGAEADALDLLPQAGPPDLRRYLVGAAPDHRIAAAAVGRGAKDYFALPPDLELLRRTLERDAREALAGRAAADFAQAEREATGFDAILGSSPNMQQVIALARRVAAHGDVTVLIGGETGTGKELLARAIHYHGPRARQPFVEINCTAIPENLIESELFGHEKGSFTGAIAAKPGLFELAHGGTIFLDEIGHLPLAVQPKLLRALEAREIRRVGGSQPRKIDVRVITATHVNLAQAVRDGTFREDLFYRLNVVSLMLPPLRERGDDVLLLAERFVTDLAARYGLPCPTLSAEHRRTLMAHHWPGNVRELRNTVERALILSPPGTLDLSELTTPRAPAAGESSGGVLPFPAPLDAIIGGAVRAMLELTHGNKSEAARRLGISRPRLQRILDGESDS